jgi:hypothetical protein
MFVAAWAFVDGPIVRTATGFDKRGAEIVGWLELSWEAPLRAVVTSSYPRLGS